jgi:hypothetical protein
LGLFLSQNPAFFGAHNRNPNALSPSTALLSFLFPIKTSAWGQKSSQNPYPPSLSLLSLSTVASSLPPGRLGVSFLEAAGCGMDVHRPPNAPPGVAAAGLGDLFPHEPAMVRFFFPFRFPVLGFAWPRNRGSGCGCFGGREEPGRVLLLRFECFLGGSLVQRLLGV